MAVAMSRTQTGGVLFIHGAPAALCPHITWAIEAVLDQQVTFDWIAQPAAPRMMRTELSWSGAPGTGAELASALRGWDGLRYEVTEDPSPGCDGARWSYTPRLGIHHTMTSASGDAVVQEDRLREAMLRTRGDVEALQDEIDLLLGLPWDEELEVFRYAGDGAAVRWMHKVG
ncbi:DUF3145 domain-containing protein [Terrabacter aerolatus]|uniref:DUF3145 domain-containing protein n=1 Tax=Terrabacter aerolatus TaxID=422442 RepID=A0A512D678_9MICO|nr:DUF3145 domain-containing protein [Terrabacter aerolatus]GEO31975.1 hypothetical protein TAE01_37850 [Terrabacter aerolatus]